MLIFYLNFNHNSLSGHPSPSFKRSIPLIVTLSDTAYTEPSVANVIYLLENDF